MKKIQLSPDSTNGGTPPRETLQQANDRLTAENSELKAEKEKSEAELEKYKSAEAQRAADEKIIIEKMTHGLSRPQAMNVIQRQRDFDAAKEKSDKSKVQPPSPGTGATSSPKSKAQSPKSN